MRFVFPDIQYRDQVTEFIQEFYDYKSELNGTGELERYLKDSTYSEWLYRLQEEAQNPEGTGTVPSSTYFYMDEKDRMIGMANLRTKLDSFYLEQGGHVGFCIRPTMRKKGYGTRLLQELCGICGMMGLDRILVTCLKENVASAALIRKCGGVLENEIRSEKYKAIVQRYWIETRFL